MMIIARYDVSMPPKVNRVTVDLKFGPRIDAAVAAASRRAWSVFSSFFPLHVGMRQYWRDFESLKTWARSLPHQKWWQNFVRDSGGTGFWSCGEHRTTRGPSGPGFPARLPRPDAYATKTPETLTRQCRAAATQAPPASAIPSRAASQI